MGNWSERTIYLLRGGIIRAGLEIVTSTDSDSKKWGNTIYNIPIISPDQLMDIEYDYIFVAIDHLTAFEEVLSTAKGIGFQRMI